jgi:hypothetical protein
MVVDLAGVEPRALHANKLAANLILNARLPVYPFGSGLARHHD